MNTIEAGIANDSGVMGETCNNGAKVETMEVDATNYDWAEVLMFIGIGQEVFNGETDVVVVAIDDDFKAGILIIPMGAFPVLFQGSFDKFAGIFAQVEGHPVSAQLDV